jgi:RIO kinase 1
VRPHEDLSPVRSRKRRFDDAETFAKRARPRQLEAIDDSPDEGSRWSTWDQSIPTQRGPRPHPDWLVTELAAVDTELGVLKTGKEADVFLIERGVPGTDRTCLLAAKRYRDAEHRMFHRDAGYLEGRQVRETRTNRAMSSRTSFGRQVIAAQWAAAEFGALCGLWQLGVPVPYPVQILGTEVLLEFLGSKDGGLAAPRLAQLRFDTADLPDLWRQLLDALSLMARAGLAHGDLSAYNLLVHDGRLVVIDLPQVVDVIANPNGPEFLRRDAHNVAGWFASHGVPEADGDELTALLLADAGLR